MHRAAVQQTAAPITQMDKNMKAAAGIVDLLIENPVRRNRFRRHPRL